jgi:hypothetical protein
MRQGGQGSHTGDTTALTTCLTPRDNLLRLRFNSRTHEPLQQSYNSPLTFLAGLPFLTRRGPLRDERSRLNPPYSSLHDSPRRIQTKTLASEHGECNRFSFTLVTTIIDLGVLHEAFLPWCAARATCHARTHSSVRCFLGIAACLLDLGHEHTEMIMITLRSGRP